MPDRNQVWTVAGVVAGLVTLVALLIGSRLRGISLATTLKADPVLTVIPAPSRTATPPATQRLTDTPQPTAPATRSGPKEFRVGDLVQVLGTRGDGLRIRSGPSLSAEVLFLGLESEVFEVVEGPTPADGYTWWRLTNPFDLEKAGWAADQFLELIEG